VFSVLAVVLLAFALFWKRPEEARIAKITPPQPLETVTQSAESGLAPAPSKEIEVAKVEAPEPIKVATLLNNDKEIIDNIDILQNAELLENMNVVNELDVIEDFDSGIS